MAHDLRLEAPVVIFAGMVAPEEVPDWYRLGDLFVSASSSETQGLTYIEALAAGVPPCAGRISAWRASSWRERTAGSTTALRSSGSGWRSSWPARRPTKR